METNIEEWYEDCKTVRKYIVTMILNSHSGHPGGSLSCVEILVYLYKNIMDVNKDVFILSKGHTAPALYATLATEKIIDSNILYEFRINGGRLKGHPSRLQTKEIEIGLGSLGMGLSIAVGESLALRGKNKVFVLTGDGELNEGSNWEAIMSAAHYNLKNLVLIIDINKLQLDGPTNKVLKNENLYNKFTSFGWKTIEIDGHDFYQIENAFKLTVNQNKPICILAHTIKGKGISFMENNVDWHSVRIVNYYEKYKRIALNELEEV